MNSQITQRRNFLKRLSSPLTIGFTAIADFSSFIGQEYLAGIMKAADNYGVNFINMTSSFHPSLFVDTDFFPQYLAKIPFMRAPLLDGLITWASSLNGYLPNAKIQELFASLAPLPMVDIGYLDIPGVPCIRIDNTYSIHLLVEHLVKAHGFTKIAFVGSRYSRPHLLRLECFKKEISALGLSVDENTVFLADSLNAQDILSQVDALLAGHWHDGDCDIEAVLTSSDIIAHHVIEAFEKRGISVPDDIAVTGFNNQLAGLTATSPVTTIDLAYFKRGYEAVELLIDQIMNPQQKIEERMVNTSLVIRQSCGCFEHTILDAQDGESSFLMHEAKTLDSDCDVRAYLKNATDSIFPNDTDERRLALVEAITSDIYDTNVPPPRSILTWFRTELKSKAFSRDEILSLTEKISALRRAVLPLVLDDRTLCLRMENIFHALRSLHATHERYEMISHQGESHETAHIMELALNLASVESVRELENVLRLKIASLSIPGIILVLSPTLTEELSPSAIDLVIPEPENALKSLPVRVREPAVFPKKFFPKNKPFALTLTILFHNARYIGYAYVSMNNGNLALYDDIRELLSQNLYRMYVREGRTKGRTLIVTNREQLAQNIPYLPEENPTVKHGRLTAESIVDYLLDHLDEMCDLDKMASFFGMSKSYITRRTRELTGYSTQILHERLKIEQAKNLIKSGKMKMNDIATRLGFSNPNYFSNVFKKVTGIRPTEFAEQVKKH